MPDLATSKNIKFPCGICKKSVAKNHRAIQCDNCDSWIHIKCQYLDSNDYKKFQNDSSRTFLCIPCKSDLFPFTNLNNNEFDVLLSKGINFIDKDLIDMAPSGNQKALFDQLNEAIQHNILDLDSDYDTDMPVLDCRYFSIDEFRHQKFNPDKSFSIFHLNIHSIDLHIEELRVALQLLDFRFDFICISESKIEKDQAQTQTDISLEGYQSPISTPTESTKGGVLLYAKLGINVIPRDDISNTFYRPKELESVFVEIVNPSQSNSILGSLYRHPSMDEKLFNDHYMVALKNLREKESSKNFYISGDFNFDLLKTSSHPETSNFFDAMMSCYLLPSITIPTKINSKNNTVIDNIFTSQYHPDLKSGNLLIGISDHIPSFLIMPKSNQNHIPKKQNIFKRDTKNFDRENFVLDFLGIDWTECLELDKNDVNHSTSQFIHKMNELLDKYLPLKKLSQKQFKQRYKPWISDYILERISLKNKFLQRSAKCKNPLEKNILYNRYKDLKNYITNLVRNGKKEFYKNYFDENKKNMKKIWQGIKDIVNIKNKHFDQLSCIQNGDKTVTEPLEISNSFNKYFTSIADNILKKRKHTGNKSFKDYLPTPLSNSIAIHPCDESEIELIISSFDVKKACGPNSIPNDLLHLLKKDIASPLALIFNLSFSSGTFPDLLKISKTIPIFKKGSRLLVSNYRPISLLSNLNKILEKLMYSRLYNFLSTHNVFYNLQFGFRSKHSTNHALLDIVEQVKISLDNKKFACGIFVDFQKAFDTVNHDILISKLNTYGVRGIANDWLRSYLSNRSQFVSILGYESTTFPQPHGVPQGSVLGPLLFLLYINDLHRAIIHSRVYHFADDTNLLNVSNSPKQMQKQVNIDLKLLYKWLLANKISLNCSKTELIIFKRRGSNLVNFSYKIKLNGLILRESEYIKYLGVYLDSTLSGKYHCETLRPKLSRACGMLSKARHYVPKEELVSLYHAIFGSHLSYGSQVWSQDPNPHLNKIISLQKRALRTITFSDFNAHSSPIFKDLKVLKLMDNVKINNCLFVHDYLNNLLPICYNNYFSLLSDLRDIATKACELGCLFVPNYRTTKFGLKSFTRKCIDHWNFFSFKFNTNLKDISRTELKCKLTDYFIQSY